MIERTTLDSTTPEWLDAMREMYAEGDGPDQAEIRPNSADTSFQLVANGEVIGVSSQYRAMRLARQLFLAKLGQVRS